MRYSKKNYNSKSYNKRLKKNTSVKIKNKNYRKARISNRKKGTSVKYDKYSKKYRIKQYGGNPLTRLISSLPIPSLGMLGGNTSVPIQDTAALNQQQETQRIQERQNVLVTALCNQYLKNSIKGKPNTEYDGLMDNLCIDNSPQINNRIPNLNNRFSSKVVVNEPVIPKSDINMFKALTNMASLSAAPLKLGYKTVKGGVSMINNAINSRNNTPAKQTDVKSTSQNNGKLEHLKNVNIIQDVLNNNNLINSSVIVSRTTPKK